MSATGTCFDQRTINHEGKHIFLQERVLKIYLHTDDLAATESMSKGMLDRWMHGYLDGFSIMANGEAAQTCHDALAKASDRPARLIAHLNLTEGPSSAPPSDVPLLVN